MATVRGMTPEAIRALLKREVGDYNATLSVANQALSNSMAIGDSISDLDEKIKNLPDILKEGNLDLDALKGELSELQEELKKNEELVKSIQDDMPGEWTLEDGSVTTNKLADNAVTTAKIIDNAIVAEKIAADAVTANKIAADAVTANKIKAGAVTTDKIAANAVVADKIAARSIGVQKLLVSAGNLFPDPDFLDPTWSRFSTSEGLRITANGKQTGTYYSPDGITSYTSMLLEPNAVYRLTLNLRFEASAPLSQMDVYVRYRNNEGGRKILLVGSFTKDSTNEGQYSDSSVLITMPSDMKDGRCELGFFVQKNMPSGSLDIRSARLLRATDAAMVLSLIHI